MRKSWVWPNVTLFYVVNGLVNGKCLTERILKFNGYPNIFLCNCRKPVTPSRDTLGTENSVAGFDVIPYI